MTAPGDIQTILRDLVAIPSVTGDIDAAHNIIEYAAENLTGLGLTLQRFSSGGYPSLVAATSDLQRPKLLLQAHLDVVPAPREMFRLKEVDGQLRGRGVYDMKFAAASFLAAFHQLGEELKRFDVGVMFTTDEELGGDHGVGFLAAKGYSARELVLIPDGGDNWRVEAFAKGAWAFRATALGRSAHGSQPWNGDNAVDTILQFIDQVRQLVSVNERDGTTLVVSELQAGQAINQVPDKAVAGFDFRFSSREDQAEIQASIKQLAYEMSVTLEDYLLIQPSELDTTLPVVSQWQDIVSRQCNQELRDFSISFGASDARFFRDQGVPVIVTRPSGGGAHGNDEWIDTTEFEQFHASALELIQKFPV